MKLTKEQHEIVYSDTKKNICIIACAGSGKTTTILHRIKYLIQNCNIEPSSIMLTTFTCTATEDMVKRLRVMIGKSSKEVLIGTIDAIALQVITKYKLLTDKIYFIQEYIEIFNNLLETTNFCDKIKYLFVDEFQDINDTQFKFINLMYKKGVKICVVGDDYQNIYNFRGSNITYILNFKRYFDNSLVFTLTDNFRSTKEIVSVCNDIIKPNKNKIEKDMKGHKTGNKPIIAFLPKKEHQYLFILKTIKQLKLPLENVAVLSRNNAFLLAAQDFFNEMDIPNTLLYTIDDFQQKIKPNHLVISTFHKSKGLEWDTVFIVGLDDKYFPCDIQQIEEERRLFFVSATRAKNNLYFIISGTPTRFLKDISEKNINYYNTDSLFITNSKVINERKERQVNKMITYEDILIIKPVINSYTYKLYYTKNKIKIPSFIVENDLYQEFFYFLNLIFKKTLCKKVPISEKLKSVLYVTNYSSNITNVSGNLRVSPKEINIVNFSPLKHYLNYFQHSLIQFKNKPWNEILVHIFNLAICECVAQQRNKGLYTSPYHSWTVQIKEQLCSFIDEIKSLIKTDLISNDHYFLCDKYLILFKYSLTNHIKGEWVLEIKNNSFNKKCAIIINPFLGTIQKIKLT